MRPRRHRAGSYLARLILSALAAGAALVVLAWLFTAALVYVVLDPWRDALTLIGA